MQNFFKNKLPEFIENLIEGAPNARDKYKKKRVKPKSGRENFLQLYDRTCNKIFLYAYEYSRNVKDAETIMRDSFVYMHEHIGELRNQKNVDSWQRQCVDKAFKNLLRSQLLEMVDDGSSLPRNNKLNEFKREEIWNRIVKLAEIDPWRMVPIPQKSTLFSVLADQTISDLRYMNPIDVLSSVAIILVGVAVVVAGLYFGIKYLRKYSEAKTDTMQEIFLDEKYYSDYDLTDADQLESSELQAILTAGAKYEVDKDGKAVVIAAPKSIGNTAGTPTYTGDEEIDERLRSVIAEVIKDDMSDPQKVWALYQYVGTHVVYSEYDGRGEAANSVLLDVLEFSSGTSLHYSTYFAALANAAGYRCDVVSGFFVLNRDTEFETPAEHYWNKMSLNGVVYYLDVEADCDANGTEVRDYYFMAADGNERWELFARDHDN